MTAARRADSGLPLKASVLPSAPGYGPTVQNLSERIDVLLDGFVLEECAGWDCTAGTVTRRRRDAAGKLVLERGAPTYETLRGTVEVRWRKDGEAA